MLGDDLLEHVPDLGDHRLDHLLGGLDVLHRLALDEPAHDERLEELECHELRQPALVELQVRPGDDHRATRVVDALAEQVLTEPTLLALEHVGERLERPVARAGHRTSAAAVVEQRVDRLLEHALLVVHDDLRRAEVEQALEPVVPVDHAAVEVVQVARGEPAAVELHHRAELRRNDRHGLEDHPLGLVARLDERLDDLEPLDRALLLLALRGLDDVAQRERLLLEVEIAKQVTHGLGAHAAPEVDPEAVGRTEAILELAEDLLVADDHLRVELLEEEPRLLQTTNRLDRRLARVLTTHLDVGDHLADLQRPLADCVEVVLLRALDEAEVVRELAHVGRAPASGSTVASTPPSSPAPISRARSRFFFSTPATSAASSSDISAPERSSSWIFFRCFVIAPFFEPVAVASSLRRGASARLDLNGRRRDRTRPRAERAGDPRGSPSAARARGRDAGPRT